MMPVPPTSSDLELSPPRLISEPSGDTSESDDDDDDESIHDGFTSTVPSYLSSLELRDEYTIYYEDLIR